MDYYNDAVNKQLEGYDIEIPQTNTYLKSYNEGKNLSFKKHLEKDKNGYIVLNEDGQRVLKSRYWQDVQDLAFGKSGVSGMMLDEEKDYSKSVKQSWMRNMADKIRMYLSMQTGEWIDYKEPDYESNNDEEED